VVEIPLDQVLHRIHEPERRDESRRGRHECPRHKGTKGRLSAESEQ
jgi:hypothetical protein